MKGKEPTLVHRKVAILGFRAVGKSSLVTSMYDTEAKKALPPKRKYEKRYEKVRHQDCNFVEMRENNNSMLQACFKTARGMLNNVGLDGELVWQTLEVAYEFERDNEEDSSEDNEEDYEEEYDIEDAASYVQIDEATRKKYPDYFQSLNRDGKTIKNKDRKISIKNAYKKFISKFPEQKDHIKEDDPQVMFKMLEVAAQYMLCKYRSTSGSPEYIQSFEPSCQLFNGDNIPHMVLLAIEKRMDSENKPELQAEDWEDCGIRYKTFSKYGVSKARVTVDKCYGMLVMIIIYIYKCGFRYRILWLAWLSRNMIAHTSLFVIAVHVNNFRCTRRYFRHYIPRANTSHLQLTQDTGDSQNTKYSFSQDSKKNSDLNLDVDSDGDSDNDTDGKERITTEKFQPLEVDSPASSPKKRQSKKQKRRQQQQQQPHQVQQQHQQPQQMQQHVRQQQQQRMQELLGRQQQAQQRLMQQQQKKLQQQPPMQQKQQPGKKRSRSKRNKDRDKDRDDSIHKSEKFQPLEEDSSASSPKKQQSKKQKRHQQQQQQSKKQKKQQQQQQKKQQKQQRKQQQQQQQQQHRSANSDSDSDEEEGAPSSREDTI